MNFGIIFIVFVLTELPMVLSTCEASSDDGIGEYCVKDSEDDDNEVRMLLVGKTGVGKSTTGNTILGFRAFNSKVSAKSITRKTRLNETLRFGKKLVVVDTPGYLDTNVSKNETIEEMTKWYTLVSPGIHAILLIVEVGRFTEEDKETVEFFMSIFGIDLKDYLVVIFTNKKRLEDEDMTIDEFLDTLEKSSNIRKLIDKINGRYTAIGYKGEEEARVKEVKQILSMIDGIKGKDGRNYYSNEVFEKVQNDLKEIHEKRKEELLKQKMFFSKNDENEVRMLLVGKTGVGKSTTGNAILGFRAFNSKISATFVKKKTQFNETLRFGKKLVVVDTPGYLDTNLSKDETIEEITKWYKLLSPGIHAILLIVEVGRFTKEDQITVEFFMSVFGIDLKDYLVVIFTNKKRLEDEDMTIDEFLDTLEKSSSMRKLIDKINGRYTAIGYKGEKEARVKEVKKILSIIDGIKGKDGRNYYSNEVFEKVQNDLKEIHEKRKEELLKEIRSETRTNIINNNIGGDVWERLLVTVGYGVLAFSAYSVAGAGLAVAIALFI